MRIHCPLKVFLCALILAISAPHTLFGQHYATDDTNHVYPAHGTIYANMFVGQKTSSGEVFLHSGFTAAHWKIKLGTLVLVTNVNTGLQVIVKVNDRCRGRGVIDLTRTAAHSIGIKGCQRVTVQILPKRYNLAWEMQEVMMEQKPSWIPPNAKPHLYSKK